jgi:hypothetical protein
MLFFFDDPLSLAKLSPIYHKVLAPESQSQEGDFFYFSPLRNEFCNSALSILLIDQFGICFHLKRSEMPGNVGKIHIAFRHHTFYHR